MPVKSPSKVQQYAVGFISFNLRLALVCVFVRLFNCGKDVIPFQGRNVCLPYISETYIKYIGYITSLLPLMSLFCHRILYSHLVLNI